MKEYSYDKRSFLVGVTITSIFCLVLMVVCLLLALFNIMPALLCFVALVAFYTVWNSFISKSNSQKVIITDTSIQFYCYHRLDTYVIKDIERLSIREFPTSGKMYIRMNHPTIFKGRYWLQTKLFSDGNELFRSLLDLEYKLHPDTLKARARRVNSAYIEAEKKGLYKRKRKHRFIIHRR